MKATERVTTMRPGKLPPGGVGKIRLAGAAKQALGTVMCAYNSEAADVEEVH